MKFFINKSLYLSLLIIFVFLFVVEDDCLSQGNQGYYFSKSMRIENEIKITIPIEDFNEIYSYLQDNYNTENFFLHKMDSNFSVTFAEDLIIDQYYDNEKMQLLNGRDGIRHRKRSVLSNPEDEKHGRELMQIKIDSVGDNPLSRGEIKYKVKHYRKKEAEFDSHDFLGVIDREDRYRAILELKRFGIEPLDLFPTIKIEQNRKRVYVSYEQNPLMTVTLDSVTSTYKRETSTFIELELEINENLYTQSDSIKRQELESYSTMIFEDLKTNFPKIKQDQTPKYNKAFAQLNITEFTKPKNYVGIIILGLFCGIVLVIISIVIYKKIKNKKQV